MRAALALSLCLVATAAFAQDDADDQPAPAPKAAATPAMTAPAAKPATLSAKPATPAPQTKMIPAKAAYNPMAGQEQAALNRAEPGKDGVKRLAILRGLDKITGRPSNILAPIGVPVTYATMVITARYCYSTPQSEPPETTAFLQIEDHRPDQNARQVFSGWMLASSPSLNGLQHPLYDVWVMSCATNQPGQALPTIASTSAVKMVSPNKGANEAPAQLPEGAGQ
jgi:hypothetical protein